MVLDDNTKKRLKRSYRKRRREVEEFSAQADVRIEKLFVRRLERLVSVRRFVFLWFSLFVLLFFTLAVQIRGLNIYYQTLQPVPGGIYSEGIIGSFTNANPLYATSVADSAVSRLIFSSLFKYDQNNQLVGDLATGWRFTNSQETQYLVNLRHDVKWHDGQPLTADDVVFTYQAIQNVNTQSPLYSSWQGIKISKVDKYTVTFDLPSALSSFRYALTNGIVPRHLLVGIQPAQLRSSSFNTEPVGSGPFKWKFVQVEGTTSQNRQQIITLAANNSYYGHRPKLDGFILKTFYDDKLLVEAFQNKQLNAIGGLDRLPESLVHDNHTQTYLTPLTSAVMAFFNNSHAQFSDQNIRRALVSAVDRSQLLRLLTYPGNLVDEPLLRGQLAYDPSFAELPFNADYANQLLDQAGWPRDGNGQRSKGGQALSFEIAAQDSQNYTVLAEYLQQQWSKLGIKVDVRYYSGDDIQGTVIPNHNYDVLLYGISIGVDPDVFAYWDSSQASVTSQGHLNLSEYKSPAADSALEAGRTRSDPALRSLKYRPFLSAWRDQAPALALYQPQYLYITHGPLAGYGRTAMNTDADRFDNVANWMVREQWHNTK